MRWTSSCSLASCNLPGTASEARASMVPGKSPYSKRFLPRRYCSSGLAVGVGVVVGAAAAGGSSAEARGEATLAARRTARATRIARVLSLRGVGRERHIEGHGLARLQVDGLDHGAV